MNGELAYRWGVPAGVAVFSACVTAVFIPVSGRVGTGSVLFTAFVVTVALFPLSHPRPRRTSSVLWTTIERVAVACLALVAVGALGVAYAPPPWVVGVLGVPLVPILPLWVRLLYGRIESPRVLVVGDDPSLLLDAIRSLPTRPVGFVSPLLATRTGDVGEATRRGVDLPAVSEEGDTEGVPAPDGGIETRRVESLDDVDRLSGLSQLERVLRERNIDTVLLAFGEADRGECFGTLRVCREYGVSVLAHENLESDLLARGRVGDLVAVDLEPWPWYSRVMKRAFDVAFATVGLVALMPVILLTTVVITLDSAGPALYGQRRTARLGATFRVWKFRSMIHESEDARPGSDDDRVTRVGSVLRKTHLDEIPQLLSILVGDMSVVGPRAVWTDEEEVLMREVEGWARRWAITPGLTGLAQIRGVDSTDGATKLECDLEYVRRQSLLFDLKIVAAQLWLVLSDVLELVWRRFGRGA